MAVIKNSWPCCQKPTRFHDISSYSEGDVIEKTCPKCGTKYRITFAATSVKSMPGLLKLVWEKIGTFRKEVTEDVDA